MATYTTDLRLVLQANGENVNTWGAVLNAGMISLVDSAISGAVSVSLAGGSLSLSANNGAADQSRSAALIFTGALPGNTVVTVPAVTKIYVVQNSTTGNYTTTLTPSGGTGLVIPQGSIVLAWSDGAVMHLVGAPASTNASTLGNVAASSYARQDVLSTFNLVRLTRGQTINVSGGNYNTSAQQLQPTATAVPSPNIGNGTFSTINVVDPALVGPYALTMTSATNFNLKDPTGALVNTGTTGLPFNTGGISFTLTAGGIAFVPNDSFTINTKIYGSNYFPVNLTANGVLTNPTDLGNGVQGFTWRLKQDATGSRTLTYGTLFKFTNGAVPTLSTAPNSVDILQGVYDNVDGMIYCTFLRNES